jgi:predicted unusual protein kinase regulating ubiquinone biosynthesis (AarF/ABC1/UbiB family)
LRNDGQEQGRGDAGGASAIDCGARLCEIGWVALRQLSRAGWRRLLGRPPRGPLLALEACEQLSGSLLKFGQIMATQVENLPREYCDALMSLLDRVPPFPQQSVRAVFLEELQAVPEKIFESFEYKPIASASIGQVHRVTLPDGRCLAVKVQRPGIRQIFERDLAVLSLVVRLVHGFRIRRLYFLRIVLHELKLWTQDELDYLHEAAFCARLGENARGCPAERIPKVYWDLTTTRVLTTDYLAGPTVADLFRMRQQGDEAALEALRQAGFIPGRFVANVIANFVRGALRTGVFHADLHPANLIILPDNLVGYVDFGIVGVFTPEARHRLIELMIAYAGGKPDDLSRNLLQLCAPGPDADVSGFRHEISARATEWYQEPAIPGRVRFRANVTKFMTDLLFACQRHGLELERGMTKYTRSVIVADGLISRIAPDFDFADALRTEIKQNVFEEDCESILSMPAALSFLCDLTLWLESDPHDLMAVLERTHLPEERPLPARDAGGRRSAARTRALCIAGIWVVSVLSLTMDGDWPSFRKTPSLAVLITLFMTLWTVWLAWLLRALRTR